MVYRFLRLFILVCLYDTILDVNRFSRLLTVRSHFFEADQEEATEADVTTRSQPVSPSALPDFTETCVYHDLMDLAREAEEQGLSTKYPERFVTSNPQFYPVNSRSGVLDAFQDRIESDLRELSRKSDGQHNLSGAQFWALQALRENSNIVIRQVDKGGKVVVLNRADYINEANRQLNDVSTYQRLAMDPTSAFQQEMFKLIDEGFSLGVLNQREVTYLKVLHPVAPVFYHLPKIHKSLEHPPGCPTVAGIGGLNERLGQWLDNFLQSLVLRLPVFF